MYETGYAQNDARAEPEPALPDSALEEETMLPLQPKPKMLLLRALKTNLVVHLRRRWAEPALGSLWKRSRHHLHGRIRSTTTPLRVQEDVVWMTTRTKRPSRELHPIR